MTAAARFQNEEKTKLLNKVDILIFIVPTEALGVQMKCARASMRALLIKENLHEENKLCLCIVSVNFIYLFLADRHNHNTRHGDAQDAGPPDLDAARLRGQRDVPPGGQREEVPGRGDQTEHPRHRGV